MNDPRTAVGPDILDRIARLEAAIRELQTSLIGSSILGTDQTIKASHDRLDSLLGAGNAAPDGALVSGFNADLLDGMHAASLVGAGDVPPAVPSPEDDEFLATALDGKWTETTNAAAHDHAETWPGWVYVYLSASGQYYRIAQDYAPGSADFSLTAKIAYMPTVNTMQCHLTAFTSSEADAIRSTWSFSNNWLGALETRDNNAWTTRATWVASCQPQVYLHLQRVAGTWTTWVSFDGQGFKNTGSSTKVMTVHHFQVEINNNSGNQKTRCGIDWVRRDWLFL